MQLENYVFEIVDKILNCIAGVIGLFLLLYACYTWWDTQQIYENAIHMSLDMPKKQFLRKECACYLGNDIGAYNSCPHMCKYCYANYDEKSVRLNRINHNPKSAFLIGDDMPNDKVHKAVQKSWINGQISLNEFLI